MPLIYFLATPCNLPHFGPIAEALSADRLGSRKHEDEITSQFAIMASLACSPLMGFHALTILLFSNRLTSLTPPNFSLQSLVSFFAWLAWHNTLLTSRIFIRGMPFDIHIRGLPHEISRDIACHGTAPPSVSADEADWASLGCMIDQRMYPIWDTADAERSMIGISGTYKRPMEQASRCVFVSRASVGGGGVLIVTLRRAHPSRPGFLSDNPNDS